MPVNPMLSLFNHLWSSGSLIAQKNEPAPESSAFCPGGEWIGYNSRCFLFKVEQSRDHKTWEDAQAYVNYVQFVLNGPCSRNVPNDPKVLGITKNLE